jgi:ABC-type antimicrobial peptide transport system permease subunit
MVMLALEESGNSFRNGFRRARFAPNPESSAMTVSYILPAKMSSLFLPGYHLDRALSQERLTASLLSGLGLLALALAVIGIYGVMSFSVAQRTREIGIRMALGAQAPEVLAMILRHAALPLGAGLAIGWAAAAIVSRYAASLLYGVGPTDPWTFVAMASLLGAAAMIACYLPARRAARIDPTVALRYE